VRLVVCLVLLLFGIGWLAAAWSPVPTSVANIDEPQIEHVWRRTAQGWERVRWNDRMRVVPFEPSLHPGVVTLFEVLAALTIGAYCWSRQAENRLCHSRFWTISESLRTLAALHRSLIDQPNTQLEWGRSSSTWHTSANESVGGRVQSMGASS